MMYLTRVFEYIGTDKQKGAQLGKIMTESNFVELVQQMFSRHFRTSLFEVHTVDETLVYNLLILLQVSTHATNMHFYPIGRSFPFYYIGLSTKAWNRERTWTLLDQTNIDGVSPNFAQ
jgi:hypothetical protein